MPDKPSNRSRRSVEQWTEILRRFDSSSLGVRQFCRREGIAQSSLQRWRRRLGPTAPPKFVELSPAARKTAASPTSWSLEIQLPDGIRLQFRG